MRGHLGNFVTALAILVLFLVAAEIKKGKPALTNTQQNTQGNTPRQEDALAYILFGLGILLLYRTSMIYSAYRFAAWRTQ